MKKAKRFFALLIVVLLASEGRAQQFSKADQTLIANYPLSIEKVNQYMGFEKGFAAAKASEPKFQSMTPARSLDDKINQLNNMPSFVNLARKEGTNLRELTLTGASLHMLFLATDPKKQNIFKKYCDMGYVVSPSKDQLTFAEAHSPEMVQWQKQITEYGMAN
jgi:hypothetical protein